MVFPLQNGPVIILLWSFINTVARALCQGHAQICWSRKWKGVNPQRQHRATGVPSTPWVDNTALQKAPDRWTTRSSQWWPVHEHTFAWLSAPLTHPCLSPLLLLPGNTSQISCLLLVLIYALPWRKPKWRQFFILRCWNCSLPIPPKARLCNFHCVTNLSSVCISLSVMSNSLQPHGL